MAGVNDTAGSSRAAASLPHYVRELAQVPFCEALAIVPLCAASFGDGWLATLLRFS